MGYKTITVLIGFTIPRNLAILVLMNKQLQKIQSDNPWICSDYYPIVHATSIEPNDRGVLSLFIYANKVTAEIKKSICRRLPANTPLVWIQADPFEFQINSLNEFRRKVS